MLRIGTRVVIHPTDDVDWIEAETGYKDVKAGLEGKVTGLPEPGNPGYFEVELDRNGEQLCFNHRELRAV